MTIRGYVRGASVVVALTAASATLAQAAPRLKTGTYRIDPSHTYAHFRIGHRGLSVMHGRVAARQGTIHIGDDPAASGIAITFDPASVDTGDDTRDQDLRDTKGFFNVEKYPSITFKSTDVRFDEDQLEQASVAGQLTLHGVTRPVTLAVEDIACKVHPHKEDRYVCGFDARTTIQRSHFGMDAMPKGVGDRVRLSLEVEATQPIDDSKH